MWDIATGSNVCILNGHEDIIYSLCPINERFLCSGSGDRTIRIWDLQKYQYCASTFYICRASCAKILKGHEERVSALLMLNQSAHLVSGSGDHSIRIWNIDTGECLWILEGHIDTVTCLSMCNGILASGSADHTWRLWDLAATKVFL